MESKPENGSLGDSVVLKQWRPTFDRSGWFYTGNMGVNSDRFPRYADAILLPDGEEPQVEIVKSDRPQFIECRRQWLTPPPPLPIEERLRLAHKFKKTLDADAIAAKMQPQTETPEPPAASIATFEEPELIWEPIAEAIAGVDGSKVQLALPF